MESILARALEYTLKYWLKSFSRDQFKLQGRTVQLSNLDINGDALHASMGLPPALHVTTAKVGKLEIMLPYISNVQVEPIVIQIDRLDLVLEESRDVDLPKSPSSSQPSTTAGKGSGYGFADKIADGMTIQVRTVNLLLETRGAANSEGDATWAPPMASVTIRNLVLYTTNENWQLVNLKEARDFSSNKMSIYVFKKLEWESLSVDLLPHPDMFTDANLARSQEVNQRDDDGAKRVFFGGERFIEGIAGEAYITIQRTELNSPLGLEVQLHITEVVCPALSEPGLRALLRFLTGIYVCLNRGDVDINTHQGSAEAAGCSLVSFVVDHMFLCIKDAEFRLELLMQSLFFSRASIYDGEKTSNLTKVMIGGLFLRDTFSRSPCTLVQPSMSAVTDTSINVPGFGKDFLPPIYPLCEQPWQSPVGVPLICLHSLQVQPSPAPPAFVLQTVICCQPLLVNLQEESCLRISSFLADGVVVNPGAVVSDSSINCLLFELRELDVSVPLDTKRLDYPSSNGDLPLENSFAGARLHIGKLYFHESPSLKLKLLNLEKDPACFSLWQGQPIDASQKKWKAGALHVSLSLETSAGLGGQNSVSCSSGLWMCVELSEATVEVAMISGDGNPLTIIPPPGGVVRMGIACQKYLSNTSVEQLFFVLGLYAYFGSVTEKIAAVGKTKRLKKIMNASSSRSFTENAPCDTAVNLMVTDLQLRFLESSSMNIQEWPLVQFIGNDLFIKVSHRTLGGAIAVSSTLSWKSVEVDCVDAEGKIGHEYAAMSTPAENGILVTGNGYHPLRPVFWIDNHKMHPPNRKFAGAPFLDISMAHVIPLNERDKECHSLSVSACISGVRLGGGMNYTEALLHRFGILGPDGGPGEGLSKGLENLPAGPLSKLLKPSVLLEDDLGCGGTLGEKKDGGTFQLGLPDDVDVSIELRDWLFALEGAQDLAERWWFDHQEAHTREQRCWHTVFQSLRVKAKSSPLNVTNSGRKLHAMDNYPVESVTVGIEGLEVLKPRAQMGSPQFVSPENGSKGSFETSGGVNFEVRLVTSEGNTEDEMVNWVAENLKFSVNQPIEAIVTKDELTHLAGLCKSEVDSMGRIIAGFLRLLKLENSVGKETIYKLSNLGTEGFDKIFSSDKQSKGTEIGTNGLPSYVNRPTSETRSTKLQSTVASLEKAVMDSKAKCAALVTGLGHSESSEEHLSSIRELNHKLESMQNLLAQLRTQI